MQNQQMLEIFCDSMEKFAQAMNKLEEKEIKHKRQTRRLITLVMTALSIIFLGIATHIWSFAINMEQVVRSIDELTHNMGYTQGVLHGISERVEDMEGNVQKVPMISGMMQAFNVKLPLITQEMKGINQDLAGFDQSLGRLDTSLLNMSGSMQNITMQVHNIAQHTSQFARVSAP